MDDEWSVSKDLEGNPRDQIGVLSQHLSGRTEETHDHESGEPLSRPRLEPNKNLGRYIQTSLLGYSLLRAAFAGQCDVLFRFSDVRCYEKGQASDFVSQA
jgi:hypothetical protein